MAVPVTNPQAAGGVESLKRAKDSVERSTITSHYSFLIPFIATGAP